MFLVSLKLTLDITLQNSLSDYRRLKPCLATIYEGYTALTRPRAGLGEKTINKPKRELKGLKKRPVFFSRQITITMDPCSKAIELLAIEYPVKLGVLKSCVLPIGQSETWI